MEIVLNDKTVSEAIKTYKAEMKQLAKPATIEEAEAVLSKVSPYDLTRFLRKGMIAGEISRVKTGGVVKSYGIVYSGWGDVFVPPCLMSSGYRDGEVVVVWVNEGQGVKSAKRIVPINDYIYWQDNRGEILTKIMEFIDRQRTNQCHA